MKNFYEIDRSADKWNTGCAGSCFIAASLTGSSEPDADRAGKPRGRISAGIDAAVNATRKVLCKDGKRPRYLLHIQNGIMVFIMLTLSLVTNHEANARLLWLDGFLFLVWLFLAKVGSEMAPDKKEPYHQQAWRQKWKANQSFQQLQISEDAREVDVLQRIVLPEGTQCVNVSMYVFRREDMLCFADTQRRYELPIREMHHLRLVKNPMVIQGWNKVEPVYSATFKPYDLRMDEEGQVCTGYCGLLELTHEGSDWAVWLAPYELSCISTLTGLPITED